MIEQDNFAIQLPVIYEDFDSYDCDIDLSERCILRWTENWLGRQT